MARIVTDRVIPQSAEIEFRASRAGGPGGQHVNRRETRIEARWNVLKSASISEAERARILAKLGARIGKDGVLRVVAEAERSQYRNKELATSRLQELVAAALEVPKQRKPTRPSRSAREERLREKKLRGEIKALRKKPPADE